MPQVTKNLLGSPLATFLALDYFISCGALTVAQGAYSGFIFDFPLSKPTNYIANPTENCVQTSQ